MKLAFFGIVVLLVIVSGAHAQDAASTGIYNGACGSASYTGTQVPHPMTVDANGNLCISVGGAPSSAAGLVPVVSAALKSSHVLKNAAGVLYSIYSTDFTGGSSGFLQVFDATSAPGDGAVTPKVCLRFSGPGVLDANWSGPPAKFLVGIVAVVSSSTTCFTKTTGTVTAFISGMVQ